MLLGQESYTVMQCHAYCNYDDSLRCRLRNSNSSARDYATFSYDKMSISVQQVFSIAGTRVRSKHCRSACIILYSEYILDYIFNIRKIDIHYYYYYVIIPSKHKYIFFYTPISCYLIYLYGVF